MVHESISGGPFIGYLRGQGRPTTQSDWFDTSGASIALKHDFLTDSANRVKAVPHAGSIGSEWAGAAPSIFKDDDGTHYIALRQRESGVAGYRWDIWENTGTLLSSTDWVKRWDLLTGDVSNATINSIEAPALRKHDGTYYLYICYQPGSDWPTSGTISYVTSDTIDGLKTKLSDGNNWVDIRDSGVKDPRLHRHDGTYYMVHSIADSLKHPLLRSSDSGFGSYTEIADVAKPYADNYTPDSINTGAFFYDTTANQYVYWASANHAGDIYWWWTVSDDLKNWSLYDRALQQSWGTTITGNARYMDYHQLDDQRGILTMEWDDDGDKGLDTWVWDYSGDAAGSTETFTDGTPLAASQTSGALDTGSRIESYESTDPLSAYGGDTAAYSVYSAEGLPHGTQALRASPSDTAQYSISRTGVSTSQGNTYRANVKWGTVTGAVGVFFFTQSETREPNGYLINLTDGGKLVLYVNNSGYTLLNEHTNISYTSGVWYEIVADITGSGDWTVTLNDDSGSQIGQVTATDTTWASGGVGMRAGGGAVEKHFDNIR